MELGVGTGVVISTSLCMCFFSVSCRATYLAGEILCSPNDMVRLSAILCQISKGNYSKNK